MKKITDKIDYDDVRIEAQGCQDDCPVYEYSNKASTTEPDTVGPPAITSCACKEIIDHNSNTWPLW